MPKHIVKQDFDGGRKLDNPIYWCGRINQRHEWYFIDTHHAAMSVDGSQQMCKQCVKSIIKQFEDGLGSTSKP